MMRIAWLGVAAAPPSPPDAGAPAGAAHAARTSAAISGRASRANRERHPTWDGCVFMGSPLFVSSQLTDETSGSRRRRQHFTGSARRVGIEGIAQSIADVVDGHTRDEDH